MPKLAMSDSEKKNRLARATIIHNMEQYGISYSDIAKVFGKTERTARNKVNNIESCTLFDLRVFIKLLKLTEDQIIDLMGGTKV